MNELELLTAIHQHERTILHQQRQSQLHPNLFERTIARRRRVIETLNKQNNFKN